MLRGDVQGEDIGDLTQRLAAVSQKSMQCGDHLRTLAHGGGDALDRSRTHVADREYPPAAGFERKSIAARRVAGQNEPLRVQGNGRAAQPIVFGDAPMNRNRCRIGRRVSAVASPTRQRTASSRPSAPSSPVT
jgi:hypothetical protein